VGERGGGGKGDTVWAWGLETQEGDGREVGNKTDLKVSSGVNRGRRGRVWKGKRRREKRG